MRIIIIGLTWSWRVGSISTLSKGTIITNKLVIYHSKLEYLKISTSRRQTIHVGSDKNYAKSKKFQFDIATNEKPVAFLGSILVENSGVDILVSLGL